MLPPVVHGRPSTPLQPGTCIRRSPVPSIDWLTALEPNAQWRAVREPPTLPPPTGLHYLSSHLMTCRLMFERRGALDWLFGLRCVQQRFGPRLRFESSADTLCRVFLVFLSWRVRPLCLALCTICRVTVRCGIALFPTHSFARDDRPACAGESC